MPNVINSHLRIFSIFVKNISFKNWSWPGTVNITKLYSGGFIVGVSLGKTVGLIFNRPECVNYVFKVRVRVRFSRIFAQQTR